MSGAGRDFDDVALAGPELWPVDDGLTEADTADIRPFAPLDAEPLLEAAPARVEREWAELIPVANMSSWAASPAPIRQWLLENWIPLGQATYLTGPGSAGKSLLAQQLCTCVALGLPFMGVPTRRSRAMYLSCEDDVDELWRRQEAICRTLGTSIERTIDRLRLVSLAGHIGVELATFAGGRGDAAELKPVIRPTERFAALEGTAIAEEVGFIALDNVAHLFAGNENVRVEVAAFIGLLNRLALRTSGAVLLIGHPNKAGDSFSGSTAWENQVRSRLFLEIAKTEEGHVNDPDVRSLRREKSNYASHGTELTFRWHDWAYLRDEDLPESLAERLSATADAAAHNARFLACLAEMTRQHRNVSERTASNYAPKLFASMPEAKGSTKRDLARAMDRLFRAGQLERAELWRGPDRKPVYGLRETAGNQIADDEEDRQ